MCIALCLRLCIESHIPLGIVLLQGGPCGSVQLDSRRCCAL
jgi:hypothetical protein